MSESVHDALTSYRQRMEQLADDGAAGRVGAVGDITGSREDATENLIRLGIWRLARSQKAGKELTYARIADELNNVISQARCDERERIGQAMTDGIQKAFGDEITNLLWSALTRNDE